MSAAASQTVEQPAPDIAIRARPPSPRRLSRKVLLAGTLAAGAVIAFAVVSGLSERSDRRGAKQEAVAAASGPPESIQQASAQYDAQALGGRGDSANRDMLWGEAGPPQGVETAELQPPADPMWANSAGRPDRNEGVATQTAREPRADPQQTAQTSPILFDAGRPQASRGDDEAHLDASLTPPRSRYEIQAGNVIPAALVTGLNSDLPGRVIAQVTAPVYDSVTGDHLLIPQGARLLGTYDNGVRYGDHRILLVWNRLILPNGWSINLREMSASDPAGASGLRDKTDNHLDRLGAAIGLSAIISVIANEAEDDQDAGSLTQSVGDAAAQQAAQTGGRIVDRELTVRPSLTVRPGAAVRVLVTRDIGLSPYR